MSAALLLAAALAVAPDTLPRITLSDAIRRATQLDPNYVQALGQIDNAEWGRRAARLAFVIPSISIGLDATKYSSAFFNLGLGEPRSTSVTSRVSASYELFSLRKISDLTLTSAGLQSAQAGELRQRFLTAFSTEADYYDVLANEELLRVASERVQRAEEQLGVTRARVVSGAAVQSDSLQLLLEVTRARVDSLRQGSALSVARLQLGRRVGAPGPVAAIPLDSAPPLELPVTLPEAVTAALEQGPQYRTARANERAAAAALRSERGEYLPRLTVSAANQRFDDTFFPNAASISSITLGVSLPIWDGGARELAISQARVNRDVSRAILGDLERAARRDVTEAYEAYTTAIASINLSNTAVLVARENFRVQDLRYRGGATTILELIEAQLNLSQAEADLVRARYSARLALAGLEAILGRRLFSNKDAL